MVSVLLAFRWVLMLVFVDAAVRKLSERGRAETKDAVVNYGIPRLLVTPVAAALPLVELTLGLSVGFGVMIVAAASLTAVLLLGFSVMVGWHLLHGRRFACGCGGGGSTSWTLVVRDLALAVAASVVALGPSEGLALWAGWGTSSASSLGQLVPIPLIVVLIAACARLMWVGSWPLRVSSIPNSHLR